MAVKKKDRAFGCVNGCIMILLSAMFIIPFLLILSASVTRNSVLQANGVSLLIRGFNLEGYKYLFSMSDLFVRSIFFTLGLAFLVAALNILVATLAAYALSKKYLVGRRVISFVILCSGLFNGGMIPTYLVIRAIGIYDTMWALVLPSVAGSYNMLLMRNYFYGIPTSLEDAAKIDGAGDLQVLVKTYLPLSMPMMFTIGLMSFVGRWNGWMDSLLYLGANSENLWTIQYVLQQMLTDMQSLFGSTSSTSLTTAPLLQIENAAIVITAIPLVLLSPLLQKFFTRGLTAGGEKG